MSSADSSSAVTERLDDIAKVLVLLLREDRSGQEVIEQLHGVGIGPTRIATLMGTTAGYVNTAVSRAKKEPKARKATTRD